MSIIHYISGLFLALCFGAMLIGCQSSQKTGSSSDSSPYEEKESLDDVDIVELRKTHYKLLPEDRIELRSRKTLAVNGVYKLDPGGEIQVPELGKIKAQGMTTRQLLEQLKNTAEAKGIDLDDLNVILVESSGRHVHVFGAVAKQGAQSFQQNQSLQGLVNKAGLHSNADQSRVLILRPTPNAGFQVFEVNLTGLNQVGSSQGLIRSRDLIYVPSETESTSPQRMLELRRQFETFLPGRLTS